MGGSFQRATSSQRPITSSQLQSHLHGILQWKIRIEESKDPYLERFPTEIMVLWNHNHTIGTASALKHRPPTKELENTFTELFSSGHSPSSALDLFNEHGDDYYKVVADGSKCPTRHWCYDLYYKIFQ
ncbi:hypothetical protein M8J77_019386 [Diaphorina citri]|nr:hypothetical protein M8J77_019386 [Diaphorina citri]